MHIECTQENLSRALQIVGRMVGTRGTLPVLGNILLKTEKGRLKLAATDLEIGVQTWIGGKVEKEGAITVPSRLFIDYISTNTDEIISLRVDDTTLHLTSDHFKANIKGIDASEFPLIPEIPKNQPLIIKAAELKEAITQTVFATAVDETRPVLTGVLWKVDGGQVKLAATDSYRLAERRLQVSETTSNLQVIIPSRTLQEVSRIITDQLTDATVYIAENQILFILGETEFISRLIDGTFPDYEQIIPKETTTKVEIPKAAFGQIMKMASFFARETANNVELHVRDGNGVEVSAISPQLGDTISQLDAQVQGESVDIAFNAKFILDALAVLPGDKIQLGLSGKLQPGVLRPITNQNYFYLIMPLRVDA